MIEKFAHTMKQVGVLYVDVYPCRVTEAGNIEFLLFKRRDDVVMPGVWQGISGKIKENEKISAAFSRQVAKKVGHAPKRLFKLDMVNTFYDDYYDTVMFVPSAGCVVDNVTAIDETLHSEYKFVTEADLPEFIHFPNQLKAFEMAAEHLRKYRDGHPTNELPL